MTMGKPLTLKGKEVERQEDMTVAELKQEYGFPPGDVLVYSDGVDTYSLADTDRIGRIPDGAVISSLPDNEQLFG